ncbi:MAG: toxin-antitoxin system YwqK family antitoxin [Helicobacteraceae bacterium]|jgi:hypothetical protein|nr:toxin-antitoxin system YwqK family antitoxin [Helicobacteraceae bacterium]
MKRVLIAILLTAVCQSAETDYKVYELGKTARVDDKGKCLDMKGNLLPGKAELQKPDEFEDYATIGTRCINGEAIEERGYYESGELGYIGPLKNSKYEGVGKSFYVSGKLKSESSFKNGTFEGLAKFFYESGKLKSEIPFKNGEREGEIKLFRENGKILGVFTYKNNKVIRGVCYETNGEKRPFTKAEQEHWDLNEEVTCD